MSNLEQGSNSAVPASKRGKLLGVAALVTGAVGLFLAFIPLFNILGGLLGLVGGTLGLVALLQKGRKSGQAVAGVSLSGAAIFLLIGFTYATALGSAGDETAYEAPSPATQEEQAPDPVEDESNSAAQEPQAEAQEEVDATASESQGTRENPFLIGTTIQTERRGAPEWEITVGPVTLLADDLIAAENQFNDPAPEGFQYALVSLDVTYIGEETGKPWVAIDVEFVSSAGTTHRTTDQSAVAPDPLRDINELFPGASGSGNIDVLVPSENVEEGTWRLSAGSSEIFFEAE